MKWLSKLLDKVFKNTELLSKISSIEKISKLEDCSVKDLVIIVNRMGDAHGAKLAMEEQLNCRVTLIWDMDQLNDLKVDHYIIAKNGRNNPQFDAILWKIRNRFS